MENTLPSQNEESKFLVKPCRICGRTFQPSSLERHEKVCERSRKTIRRKKFDSFLQRTKDIIPFPLTKVEKVLTEDPKKQKKKCRENHHENSTKTSPSHHLTKSRTCPVIPLGYIQCPVCQRCFNHKAADRHIKWCQEQVIRMPKSPPSSEALQRLRARTQYRAPLPGKKRNSSVVDAQRLVKSADATSKSPGIQRTFSSPGLLGSRAKHVAFQESVQTFPCRGQSCERPTNTKSCEGREKYFTLPHRSSRSADSSYVPVVKFKDDLFSSDDDRRDSFYEDTNDNDYEEYIDEFDYDSEEHDSNHNYEILSALRMKFSELKTEDFDDECTDNHATHYKAVRSARNNSLPTLSGSKQSTPSKISNERSLSRSTNSSESITPPPTAAPNCNNEGAGISNSEQPRMPRFCYQCGTKYPVQSAKYCCECGSKRLVLTPNGNLSPVC